MELYTWPSADILDKMARRTPQQMYPNKTPLAGILKGYISNRLCDDLVAFGELFERYTFHQCGAATRELDIALRSDLFRPILELASLANSTWWGYRIDVGKPMAWMQTYQNGGKYRLHTDTSPGENRKLTAVLQLSDENDYTGGDLEIFQPVTSILAPRERGSLIFFQPWLHHQVTPVPEGKRQSINFGWYGPPFK